MYNVPVLPTAQYLTRKPNSAPSQRLPRADYAKGISRRKPGKGPGKCGVAASRQSAAVIQEENQWRCRDAAPRLRFTESFQAIAARNYQAGQLLPNPGWASQFYGPFINGLKTPGPLV